MSLKSQKSVVKKPVNKNKLIKKQLQINKTLQRKSDRKLKGVI